MTRQAEQGVKSNPLNPPYYPSGACPAVTTENGYGTGTATFTNVNSLVERETAEGSYEFFCG